MLNLGVMRLFGAGVVLGGGYLFFGGAPTSGIYPIDIATAENKLRFMDFDEGMLDGMRFSLTSADAGEGRVLRWKVRTKNKRAPETICSVELTAKGDAKTRSDLDCTSQGGTGDPEIAERAGELVQLVMAEHVDATLAERPFDHDRMGKALYAFAIATQPMIVRKIGSDLDEVAKNSNARERERNDRREDQARAARHRAEVEAAGKPTMILK